MDAAPKLLREQEPGEARLSEAGLRHFLALQFAAVSAVTDRFHASHGSVYERFGQRGRDACREDLMFHLEFLRPVLEFGLLQPMVDYLSWLGSVLAARAIPAEHVALSLDWLAQFFAARMAPDDAAVVTAALRSAQRKVSGTGWPPKPPETWPEAAALEAALLAGDQHTALALMNRSIESGADLIAFELHVLQPALYAIGEKWQANQVSVAQEHMATAIAQSVMTTGLLRSAPAVTNGKRALLSCVEGNGHSLGARMLADAFQLGGREVQYLGASVPTVALVRHVGMWKPDLVGLSVSFPQQLRVAKEIVAQFRETFGSARPATIIGGLAINRLPELVGFVGADSWGVDARAAVVCADRLVRG